MRPVAWAPAGHLTNAQRVKGRKAVGPQLHTGADLAQLRRLFKRLHRKALPHQRQGRSNAANAADATTGNQHGKRGRGGGESGRGGSKHGLLRERHQADIQYTDDKCSDKLRLAI